jgi:hypothetical protein
MLDGGFLLRPFQFLTRQFSFVAVSKRDIIPPKPRVSRGPWEGLAALSQTDTGLGRSQERPFVLERGLLVRL